MVIDESHIKLAVFVIGAFFVTVDKSGDACDGRVVQIAEIRCIDAAANLQNAHGKRGSVIPNAVGAAFLQIAEQHQTLFKGKARVAVHAGCDACIILMVEHAEIGREFIQAFDVVKL